MESSTAHGAAASTLLPMFLGFLEQPHNLVDGALSVGTPLFRVRQVVERHLIGFLLKCRAYLLVHREPSPFQALSEGALDDTLRLFTSIPYSPRLCGLDLRQDLDCPLLPDHGSPVIDDGMPVSESMGRAFPFRMARFHFARDTKSGPPFDGATRIGTRAEKRAHDARVAASHRGNERGQT